MRPGAPRRTSRRTGPCRPLPTAPATTPSTGAARSQAEVDGLPLSDRFHPRAAAPIGSPEWSARSGSSGRSRSSVGPGAGRASRAGGRSRCSPCCSCTAARSSRSTGSSTSCGRATGPQQRPQRRPGRRVAAARARWARRRALRGARLRRAPAGGALDADRFEDAPAARRASSSTRGEPREAAATLREALALWRGPALADVADERFAQPEIARLEDLRLACLERPDRRRPGLRPPRGAGRRARGARAEHPLRERLRGQQMLALYRCRAPGRRAGRLPQRVRGARRRARHRAVAGAASARGGDPAPGRAAPARAAGARPRRRATCAGA